MKQRTPLIISANSNQDVSLYKKINNMILKLTNSDFDIEEKSKGVSLTDTGIEKVESILKKSNLIKSETKSLRC